MADRIFARTITTSHDMRILTVLSDLGPGGTQRVAQNYSLGYRNAGHDVAVLGYAGGGPRAKVLREEQISVFEGGEDRDRQAAIEASSDWNPDLLHVHREGRANPTSGAVLSELKRLRGDGVPVVETNVFARVDYSPDRTLIDAHLVLSRWCLWKWNRWVRTIKPRPVGVVVPNAVDAREFYPPGDGEIEAFRVEHGIPPDAFVFGRIGQPAIWKWSPLIFEACRQVATRNKRAFLLIVGLPDGLRSGLEQLDADTRKRIVEIPFLHSDEDLRAAYGSMDVFLHAAQIGESFGMVLVESMLCGTPVITLSTPRRDNSQLEVVGHETGGLVVADLHNMVQAMELLMEDGELRQRLADGGNARARAKFTLDRVMPGLLRVVEHVAAATDSSDLRRRLEGDDALITQVGEREIRELLGRSLGSPSMADRVVMRLVHSPHIYRAWSHWKFE